MSESGEREAKECWHEPWVLLPGSAGLFQWNVPLCIKQQSKKSRLAATPLLHTLLDTQERRQSEREQNDKQPPRKDRAHNNRDPWCVSPFTRGEKGGEWRGGEGRQGRKQEGDVGDAREASEMLLCARCSAWKCLSTPTARPCYQPIKPHSANTLYQHNYKGGRMTHFHTRRDRRGVI